MPKEIKGKIEVRVDSQSLRGEPELATHIGIISSMLAEIEDELCILFIVGVQTDPAIAAAILGNVFSLSVRLDMIRTALGLRLPAKALEPFDKLSRKLKKRSKERSHIVHGMWATHKDHPKVLLHLAGMTDPKLTINGYALQDFLEIELRLLQLHQSLKQFAQSLAPYLKPSVQERTKSFWRLTGLPSDEDGGKRLRHRNGSPKSTRSRRPRLKPVR